MKTFALITLILFSLPAMAGGEREFFLKIDGASVYVRHKQAAKGAPTLVLLNGLTYSTGQWADFVGALQRLSPETGILRYDMKGMGRTLLEGPLPVNYTITYQEQVGILKALLNRLNLKKIQLVGLSYGGGIGIAFANAFPRAAERLILMAPFTEALEEQDRLIRSQVAAARISNPFNPASDDELYDFFLRQFIYATYPAAEPIVLENPFKLEAVFRMVQGIRHFKAANSMNHLPGNFLHLMVAARDQYIPGPVMDRFWKDVPRGAKASRIIISSTEHKIPEAIPDYAAGWVLEILKNPEISGGREFEGNSREFNAISGDLEVRLPRP